MLRALFVAIAALSLSACATLPASFGAGGNPESFDADAAPIEAPVAEWSASPFYADVSMLDRRAFTPSPGRRSDYQARYVTAVDRRFRSHLRRRRAAIRRSRRPAIHSVLLTSQAFPPISRRSDRSGPKIAHERGPPGTPPSTFGFER